MKLPEHVEQIRILIFKAFNNQFSRLGVGPGKMVEIEKVPSELHNKREKVEVLINSHTGETGNYPDARNKALDELTFTLFNRLAAIKVMESHQLFPPIITRQAEHGDRSFGHKVWLEKNTEKRNAELEGLRDYIKFEFNQLGEYVPLYNKNYPYALLPYVIELNEIIDAFNAVEKDAQVDDNIWHSDDILGWLYESYNNTKKLEHKESGDKTEYNKVSLQSQVYTPRWVVEFLVNNSLGKLYLEMYPDSEIKNRYKIANAPAARLRDPKPLHEIKLIDPAAGSGNFLLYAFDFFYALYHDQIENFGAGYEEENIPDLIIENNLHGIDLDDRAIQLGQLGLWIKAKKKKRDIGALNFNLVSSDFYLPDYEEVQHIFEANETLDTQQKSIIVDVWTDLQKACKFGSLVKIGEKVKKRVESLYDLQNRGETDLFLSAEITQLESFEKQFFSNLETAVNRYAKQQGSSFLTDKTKDAITYLKLLTNRYDVVTANPPYTDSSDFGPDLKEFIEANYKKPYKFNTNLYASFIKRCFELTNDKGKVGLIHPHTFMFIKTFEDVRKYIIEKSHIDVMVDLGLDRVNLFGPGILLDATFYVLSKDITETKGLYFNLTTNLQEKYKKEKFLQALSDHIEGNKNERVYELEQSKLKIIKSWPFIYWISDEFREKFRYKLFEDYFKLATGLMTGNNLKHLRFYWEVNPDNLSYNNITDGKQWVPYQKGGDYNKWFGNNWLTVNYFNEGELLATTDNKAYYFRPGITYSATSSKGVSFRMLPENQIFDKKGSCIFLQDNKQKWDLNYVIAVLNSKLTFYIVNCLNSTVETQIGDIKRVPFVEPSNSIEMEVSLLSNKSIKIKKYLNSFSIIEKEFKPLQIIRGNIISDIKKSIKEFINYENYLLSQIIISEAIINEKIFEIYDFTDADKAMVLAKEGENIGALPVSKTARQAYISDPEAAKEFPLDNIREFIESLPEKEFSLSEKESIEQEFPNLYQSNNDLEEFCIRHKVNPINVWYWFKESNVIPKQRMNDLAMEFLADMLREILMEDEDGIIPLVPNAGEKLLLDRVEEKFMEKGFSMAQYSSFDSVLGRELNDYLNHHFFKALSDHLNLFMYLPKTPFIWHLTSGPEQGFDCYIIIYKWSRDKLLRIRSVYIENRERSLINRQSDLANDDTAKAQNEKDKIYKQLKEIESFKKKIDELLEVGYDPVLDDGVGKNIAPLQQKKMLAYEVLNAGQLKKYLNADW
ncbi:MAG TPA: BREX-1 system adenine-specific DNA-methyltransferase PglX [Bacteroidales bacterium]|nr:BREX-1 system adenine-specific DNA-methyltransferase PglX [Bacteroidales bacterium]